MKDRIILLIKAKNLTAAQFADEIGVQKSSISHIISGRNNASLDFIQKILICYPEVQMDWLMLGKGPIFKGLDNALNSSTDASSGALLTQNLPPVDLFSEANPEQRPEFQAENELNLEIKPIEVPVQVETEKQTPLQLNENKVNFSESKVRIQENENDNSEHKNSSSKILVKIVEFYSDNTFREYYPG